jgi:hypothetical protein
MRIRSLEELTTPDDISLRFTPLGLSTGGMLDPQYAATYQQQVIASCDLHEDVPDEVRDGFERLRTLHSYGVVCYDMFTVAEAMSWLVMEQAFRERFVTFFDYNIPFVHAQTGAGASLTVRTFEEVYRAVTRGGAYASRHWRLRARSGEPIEFRANFSHLLRWARQEGLLHGQRNRHQEELDRRFRNYVAHPSYRISTPPESARSIHNLAEIINRLWGHVTPGGRRYPAPLDREVLVVAWTDAAVGTGRTIFRASQLEAFDEPGNWTCIVVRGVLDDEGLWEFDAQYERTNLPTELLWGPGTPEDALAWWKDARPQPDTVSYLDRIFALRIHDGRSSLAMRPEVALAMPHDRQAGRWFLVRADYPSDAFNHVRHIKNGVQCGDPDAPVAQLPPGKDAASTIGQCAVEHLFAGDWSEMAAELARRCKITAAAALSTVRARPRFRLAVAPDVEAE